ncbi:MAG: LamG domain-containing protein [Planctomycetota bacterium]
MHTQGLPRINNLVRCVKSAEKTAYPEGFASGRVELVCRKIAEKAKARYEDANPGQSCGERQLLSVLVDNCLIERSEAREIVEAWKASSTETVTYRAERRFRLQQVLYDELASCNAHLELQPDVVEPDQVESDTVETDVETPISDSVAVAAETQSGFQTASASATARAEDRTRNHPILHAARRPGGGLGRLAVLGTGLLIVGGVCLWFVSSGGATDEPPSDEHPLTVRADVDAYQVLMPGVRAFGDGQPYIDIHATITTGRATLISFWMKPNSSADDRTRVVLGWGSFTTAYDDHFLLALPPDRSIRLVREQPKRGGEPGHVTSRATTAATVKTNRWQHIAVVFDPKLTVPVCLYIDGERQTLVVPPGAKDHPWPRVLPGADVLFVGGRDDFVELGNFDGEIGSVRLRQADQITDTDIRREMDRDPPGNS